MATKRGPRWARRHGFKIILAALLACVVLIVVRSVRPAPHPFALAADCPRGALVYAQFSDLPALLRQWDGSTLKQQYLGTTSFRQLAASHLGLKLVERWQEFNDALGFPLDPAAVIGAADDRAAIAVYDIGRLELCFVAPLSAERTAATRFFQTADRFEAKELPDGTTYYLHEVEADRGRQKQEICFAALRGRFVLATSERLLLRALANINGQTRQDRLSDDPTFHVLSRTASPHFVTVWLDQARLNHDWYFRHYWVMQNVDQLGQLRAGMLDLEVQDGRWVERREFVLGGRAAKRAGGVKPSDAQRIAGFVPRGAPYFRLRTLGGDPKAASELIQDALFDPLPEPETSSGWDSRQYGESDFEVDEGNGLPGGESRSSDLSDSYDLTINDPTDAGVKGHDEPSDRQLRRAAEARAESELQRALGASRPLFAGTMESPRSFEGPLFTDFRRAVIVTLQTPGSLDPRSLESALGHLAAAHLLVTGPGAGFEWAGREAGRLKWREMNLPALGRTIGYGLRGQELIVASNPELLSELLTQAEKPRPPEWSPASPVEELTWIRFDRREEAFDRVVARLDAPRVKAYWAARRGEQGGAGLPSEEFFSGNLASLLGLSACPREVIVSRSFLQGRLREEVILRLR